MPFLKKNIANAITGTGILLGIIACAMTATGPSWFWSEALLLGALITDALDGKAARKFGSTKAGPYLDDIADFINFGLHPALWIWTLTGSIGLSALYICAIFYRLARFTLQKQDTRDYFLGLPSPASAVGVFGVLIIQPSPSLLMLAIGMIAFLTISHIPCMHVMKTEWIRKNMFTLLAGCLILPWIYGGDLFALGLAQAVLTLSYILVSITTLLIPHYVLR
ncbi:CDP-alcohol phosphatidyltransferase family protein [Candidatus Gracilibacteria bacterium]|nr:CDP-alcohol phosphatidyltransferase family protein [Candidatus Gracilibacteria bacterium]